MPVLRTELSFFGTVPQNSKASFFLLVFCFVVVFFFHDEFLSSHKTLFFGMSPSVSCLMSVDVVEIPPAVASVGHPTVHSRFLWAPSRQSGSPAGWSPGRSWSYRDPLVGLLFLFFSFAFAAVFRVTLFDLPKKGFFLHH